jgi:hypothetical protein
MRSYSDTSTYRRFERWIGGGSARSFGDTSTYRNFER